MEFILALAIGIGLSAACGFRVFVPLLGLGIAASAGFVPLSSGFDWIGSPVAIAAFAVATLIEIGAYYIPWLDNLLDTISTPAAVIAGVMVTASVMVDVSPFLRWSLAIIAGGGIAGTVQTGTTVARGTSTVTSAGFANPLLSTGELLGAIVTTILSLIVPILAAILALVLFAISLRLFLKLRRRTSARAHP
jgi:hypothetical protein